MKKIKNSLISLKTTVVDAQKRRLISKNIALRHSRTVYRLSLWRYGVVLALVVVFMAGGYVIENNKNTNAGATNNSASIKTAKTVKNTIDEETSIGLALDLAEQANLSVAQDVMILSEMNAIKKEVSLQNAELTVAKATPIFDLASANRTIRYHTVAAGETIQQIADKYQVSTNTIKWANNLKDDSVSVNTQLKILPVDGIVYKVKAGDDLQKIADKYQSNAQRIELINDIEVQGIKPDQEIIIPEGILPVEERPGYVAPRPVVATPFRASGFSNYYSASGSGGRTEVQRIANLPYRRNTYADGNCTWHAYEWRARAGRPIGPFWGNGSSWAYSAAKAGFPVNRTPAAGAIFQTSAGWYGYGHVGIVEQVLENGDIVVTEMNYAGYNVTTRSIIKAQYVGSYNYIH